MTLCFLNSYFVLPISNVWQYSTFLTHWNPNLKKNWKGVSIQNQASVCAVHTASSLLLTLAIEQKNVLF